MEELMVGMFAGMFMIIIVVLILSLAMYIANGIITYKLNKKIYGKGTPMAWIPVFNYYLTIKLAINKMVGIIAMILLILTTNLSITTTNSYGLSEVKSFSIIPSPIAGIVSNAVSLLIIICFILNIIKLVKLNKTGTVAEIPNETPNFEQQPVESTVEEVKETVIPVVNESTNSEPPKGPSLDEFTLPNVDQTTDETIKSEVVVEEQIISVVQEEPVEPIVEKTVEPVVPEVKEEPKEETSSTWDMY